MGAITDAWCAFKNVCKATWQETRDMFVFDSGIDLGCPSGGLVPEETRTFVRGKGYSLKLDAADAREALGSLTSLELLEELLERQHKESK